MKRNRVEASRQKVRDGIVSIQPQPVAVASASSARTNDWTIASAIPKAGIKNAQTYPNSSRVSLQNVQIRSVQECNAMINGTVSFVASLVSSTGPRTLQRRSDDGSVELDTLTVRDQSAQDFEVKLWGSHCQFGSTLQPGCIIFFHDFEIGQFRDTTSASSRAKSFMRILSPSNSTTVKLEQTTTEFRVKQENNDHDAEASPSKKVKLEVSPSKNHSASWREKRAEEIAARIANWSDILATAQSLAKFIHSDNDKMGIRPSTKASSATSSPNALPNSIVLPSTSLPLTSFAALEAGRIVNICVVLRSCHIVHPQSSATPAQPRIASIAPTSTSSSTLNSAQTPKPRPLLVLVVSGLEENEGTSNLLELAMHQPQWLEPAWRQTWEASIGKRVQFASILVQFKKITETMSLSDTRFTTASIISAQLHPRATVLLQPFGPSNSVQPALHHRRAMIHAIEFPLLSKSSFMQFAHQSMCSSSTSPLPHYLFQQLFVASCSGCGEAMECDANRVYHCAACFTSTPGGEHSHAVRWNYRPVLIHLQLVSSSQHQPAEEHLTVQSFLMNSNIVSSSLFGDIDPVMLCETPSLASSIQRRQSQTTATTTTASQLLQQYACPAPSVASPYPSQKSEQSEQSESKESMVDSMAPASASASPSTTVNPTQVRLRRHWMRLMLTCLQNKLQYCMIELPAMSNTNSTLQCPQELATSSDRSNLPELQVFSLWQNESE